jgi:ABC-type uncharacterized transport system involved in gliding motility auxiliary subunit
MVVLIAIVVVVNLLAAGGSQRMDMTKNERYTLSKGSARLVQSLKEPILVDAYVTRGLAKLEVYTDDLTSLLKEYERDGGGKFQFTLIEAKTEELKEQAKEAGLQPLTFAAQAETGDDQAAIAQGYLGLVFKYGSEKGVQQLMPGQAQGLEFLLSNKIREIRNKADNIKHKIGLVTGKDELKLSDTNLLPKQGQGGGASIKAILDQHFPFYDMVDVELKEDSEIDPELMGLVISQPQKDYTDKELQRIDQFLMRGDKALAVFASAVNIKPNDPKMKATLSTHGLEKLLAGYGINIKKNALLDFGAHLQTPVITQAGIQAVRHPPIAHVAEDPRLEGDDRVLDTSFPTFFRLQEAAFPYPSSLEILRDKQPAEVKIDVIARTTPNTTELTDETIDMSLRLDGWQPKPPFEQHAIAAAADGPLKSAFPDAEGRGYDVPDQAEKASRVLVVSSSQFLTNPFAYSGNGPELGQQFQMFGNVGGDPQLLAVAGPYAQRYLTNTLLAVKNTMDWISGDQDLLAISAKIIGEPNLKYSSIKPENIPVDATDEDLKKIEEGYKQNRRQLQKNVAWTLTLLIPLLFGGFGVFRWRSRLARRSELKLA